MDTLSTSLDVAQISHLIPIGDLDPSDQPRVDFDKKKLSELAADIKAAGIHNPIKVRTVGKRFEIVHGERRWRAAKLAGLTHVPAFIDVASAKLRTSADTPELERLVEQVAENLHRAPLTVLDLANLLVKLRDEHSIKVSDLPAFLKTQGLGDYARSTVANYVRLVQLPTWAQGLIRDETIPPAAGKHILRLSDHPKAMKTLQDDLKQSIKNGRHVNEGFVESSVIDAFGQHFPNVDRVDYGDTKNNVRYDADKHLDALGLVTFKRAWRGDERFATDLKAHDALQEKYKDKPQRGSPAAEHQKYDAGISGTSGKADKQEKTKPAKKAITDTRSAEVVNRYLVDLFKVRIIEHHLKADGLQTAVMHWLAEGAISRGSYNYDYPDRKAIDSLDESRKAHDKRRLSDYLGTPLTPKQRLELVTNTITACEQDSLCDLVCWLNITLDQFYLIDDDYLAMHTNESIGYFAASVKLDKLEGWQACKKVGEKRTFLSLHREAILVPKDLERAWRALLKSVGAKYPTGGES